MTHELFLKEAREAVHRRVAELRDMSGEEFLRLQVDVSVYADRFARRMREANQQGVREGYAQQRYVA